MDKKAMLAVALSVVIWMAWEKYYLEPIQMRAEVQRQAEQLQQPSAGTTAGLESVLVPSKIPLSANRIAATSVLENNDSSVGLRGDQWALGAWTLHDFSRTLEKKEEKISLEESTGFGRQMRVHFSEAPALSNAADLGWNGLRQMGDRSFASGLSVPGLVAQRVFTLDPSGYGGRVEYTFQFSGTPPKFVFLDVYGNPKRLIDKEGSMFGQAPDKVKIAYRDSTGRTSVIGASLKENKETMAGVKWLGLDTRYFVLALVPQQANGSTQDIGAQVAHDNLGVPAIRGSLVFPTDGQKTVKIGAKVYFGPKNIERLKEVDPILTDAIDFGWTSAIALPLLQALKWLYSYLRNYGAAIIALTFLIKMALFPLMYKSMQSMARMQKLQPQLNALREKYKGDKEKLNVEMMSFMKSNGYNPVGGCLPIVFQMPIFFALYRVLFNSMELYQAPFGGWIHDLSSPDPFFVTPVLLCGLMYLQQKLSPNTVADPAQQKMMQFMPVMFGAFMLMLPSGLTIYMVVNSATSIAQQYFINRKLGIRRLPVTLPAKA